MKKIILALMPLIILLACTSTEHNTTSLAEEESLDTIEVIYDTPTYSTYNQRIANEAIKAAQKIVADNFDNNAVFLEDDIIVDNTQVQDRYKILQKFLSSKFGVREKFIYKIFIQKFGQDDWSYGSLDIENVSNEKNVLHLQGKMKSREKSTPGEELIVAGITFKIAEGNTNFIRIYTPKKLSREKLKAAISEIKNTYPTIYFATDSKHERGDEYCSWISGTFFDLDKNEIISGKNFLQ